MDTESPANGPTTLQPEKGLSREQISARVEAILLAATLDEKLAMMSGHGFLSAYQEDGRVWGKRPYRAGGGIERLGVPAFWFTDGPRGVTRGASTCFPCSMARGASFDRALEHRIGEAMGIEARAQDCNLSGAVCINLLRHPAWGRAQETYGEDSFHLGVMGTALALGIQSHNVCATVKHFALNSMENARFKVDVRVDERTLHEVYLPHFKMVIEAGVGSVMSAYNKVNGEFCGQNRALLTGILRDQWEFGGFVHSDWMRGVHQVYGAAAGLDVENPEPRVFGEALKAAIEAGAVEPQVVDTACRRILMTLYHFACREDPLPTYPASLVASEAHRALAQESAEKSAVLLKNDGVLPFDAARVGTLAVLGRLATIVNTGDNGSSRVNAPHVVTAIEGLQAFLGSNRIVYAEEGQDELVQQALLQCDAAVLVVGTTAAEEGEFIPGDDIGLSAAGPVQAVDRGRPSIGGDREDLGLPLAQVRLIEQAAASSKPTAVVIVSGSAILVEDWQDRPGAILQTFYSGMAGGAALARLLFGDVVPSGRIPFTLAKKAGDYPRFDRDADRVEYEYWHGYAKFDREHLEARYSFGHGLSYARFEYRALSARIDAEAIEISVAVRNMSSWPADHTILVFVSPPGNAAERPSRLLRAFDRVPVRAGETRMARFTVPLRTLRWWDPATHRWKLETGQYKVTIGASPEQPVELIVRL